MPARRPSDRLAVVEWVHGTTDLQETDWLEWKSGYDLSRTAGRVATAKHILGFANRMPDVAARHAGGCAYLLLGVEPGTSHGVKVHDSADVENWLRPYLGERVVYDIDYVAFQERSVLFVVVEPPQWGDDIHPLRKEGVEASGKTVPRGRIFVRKNGKTEPASDADVDRLTERARRQGTRLSLSVEATAPLPALPAACFEDDFRDEYLETRRRKLLSALPRHSDPFLGSLPTIGETRSPRRFAAEVAQFVERARTNWAAFAVVEEVEQSKPTLGFALVNPTDDNFEAVEVELTLPLPAQLVLLGVGDARERLKPPEPPARWGAQHASLLSRIRPVGLRLSGPEIQPAGDAATLVRFEPVHVRPRSQRSLPGLIVMARPAMAGRTLTATWRATSISTRGELTGTVDFGIVASPVPAAVSS
jgi:hypothetical protein